MQRNSTLPRIFIGGTGRSGTTILYEALGTHRSIYSLPMEMRFLVDPDGLINLISAFTTHYSPVQAREALFRFERLMRDDLNSAGRPPFLSYQMAEWLGGGFYWRRLEAFCQTLVDVEYEVVSSPYRPYQSGKRRLVASQLRRLSDWIIGEQMGAHRTTYNWPQEQRRVLRYFFQRSELVEKAADFVDDLFLHATHKNGKETWCEKTPQNLFYIHFLQELFPNSVFIHITRDPRGVAQSITKQHWGPNDIESVCAFLDNLYSRWLTYKSTLNLTDRNYLQLKLEDLALSPVSELSRIATSCRLEANFDELPDIRPEKVNYWRQTMPAEEQVLVNELLGTYIADMGYDPTFVGK